VVVNSAISSTPPNVRKDRLYKSGPWMLGKGVPRLEEGQYLCDIVASWNTWIG
jgi:hypothetical protein